MTLADIQHPQTNQSERTTIDGVTAERVLRPDSPQEVADLLHEASDAGSAVYPVGSGLHQRFGRTPERVDIAVSTLGLAGILRYDPEDLVVSVGAGTTLAELQAELATAQDALLPAGRGAYPVYQRMVALQDQIATLTAEQQTYQSVILDPRRQILLFDAANGRFAELTGTIGPDTRNVGVLVPGTTTNMGGINGNVATYGSFADQSAGSLAMITWMGGALPQSIAPEAFEASYSQALAPDLAAFTHEVRQEIEHSQAAGNAVQLTLAGHSYGGAVVGLSETYGSDADRVLHIESAGMGSGAYEPADLHPTNPDVRRYSMTAPGDLIGASQGLEVGPLGHGADPDTFAGTIRLETGYYADGSLVEGTDAHSGVFKPNSDSWAQINEVFNGGVVTTYGANEDPRILVTDGWGGAYWVDNPDYAPATHVDIP